jgi:hypothetical protein
VPQPSGTLRVCRGLYRDSFTIYLLAAVHIWTKMFVSKYLFSVIFMWTSLFLLGSVICIQYFG